MNNLYNFISFNNLQIASGLRSHKSNKFRSIDQVSRRNHLVGDKRKFQFPLNVRRIKWKDNQLLIALKIIFKAIF